jgi:hypothetical protein
MAPGRLIIREMRNFRNQLNSQELSGAADTSQTSVGNEASAFLETAGPAFQRRLRRP